MEKCPERHGCDSWGAKLLYHRVVHVVFFREGGGEGKEKEGRHYKKRDCPLCSVYAYNL